MLMGGIVLNLDVLNMEVQEGNHIIQILKEEKQTNYPFISKSISG